MKLSILLGIIVFSFNPAYSQKADSTKIFNSATYSLSYYGNNLIHPGVKAGISFLLAEKTKNKNKTKANGEIINKSTIKQLLANAGIGLFWQAESHIGSFNYYQLRYRSIKLKDNSYSLIGIGPGIYRSFYPETFEVDKNGNVKERAFGGRTYFAPVLTFGTGNLKQNSFLHSLSFTTNLMFLFDYNSGIVPLLNLEIEFCFDLRRVLKNKKV